MVLMEEGFALSRIIRRVGIFFLDIIETVVVALAIFVIAYLFLLQPHQVKGNSMLPNYHDGEFLLTDKISYRLREPERGEVVIFRAPGREEVDFIKRIIGLPGERLKIENGRVVVDGQLLAEPYLPEDSVTISGSYFGEGEEIILPEKTYFVFGDNRSHSSDSREWGPVPVENIVGRAWLRYWPLSQLGLIKNPALPAGTPSPEEAKESLRLPGNSFVNFLQPVFGFL